MNRNPLRDAIVTGLLTPGDAAQQAGGGDNSLQPTRGLLRCSGQELARHTPALDDGPCHGNGPATPEDDTLVGGALPGETDYLDAHDLIDWDEAPFAATAWAIGRAGITPATPDPEPIARWLWVRDGKVTGTLAPTFGVLIHPGRGMTLRRPPGLEALIREPRP